MTTPRNYVFYKFVCLNDDVDSCYVGSTGNFKKRKSSHKQNCQNESRKEYNIKLYQTIRENGGWDNWNMIQIGTKGQITKREAEQIEEEYRKELKADINQKRAFRTEEERKKDDIERYHNNKEYIKEYRKEYIKEYRENNRDKILEQKKQYYDNNKEKKIEYQKKYRQNNREKIYEKVKCECGNIVTRKGLSQHKKTMIHNLKLLEIGEPSE